MFRNKAFFLLVLGLTFLYIEVGAAQIGICSYQNTERMYANEDRAIAYGGNGYFLVGVFDGHCGSQVSDYLVQNIAPMFANKLEKEKGDITNDIFIDLFDSIDNRVLKSRLKGGSTALIACIKDNKIYVSNVGDSKAVFWQKNTAYATLEHSVLRGQKNQSVIDDIERMRLFGVDLVESNQSMYLRSSTCKSLLAMTRSIGDAEFKKCGLICIPDCYTFDLKNDGTEFLVLASDGFWDFFSAEEACNMVSKAKSELKLNAAEISEYLIKKVNEKAHAELIKIYGSDERPDEMVLPDDITIITVLFS